jgi:hypothetical protein
VSDRELLELAAKAAGRRLTLAGYVEIGVESTAHRDPEWEWNPLTDDGDALRLAVKLGLQVDCSRPSAGEPYKRHHIWRDDLCDNATGTRRAIVRAAAEIGRNKT